MWRVSRPIYQFLFPENRLHFYRRTTRDKILLEFSSIRKCPRMPYLECLFFNYCTSVYLYKCVIPSVGITKRTYSWNGKTAREHLLLKAFTNALIWAGLTAHPSWSEKICCASLERKNDLHLKTTLFLGLLQSNIYFFAYCNSLFTFIEHESALLAVS